MARTAKRAATCRRHRWKRAFTSKRSAHDGAVAVAKRNGDRAMTPYQCEGCGDWFLTSKVGRTI